MKTKALVSSLAFAIATLGLSATAMAEDEATSTEGATTGQQGQQDNTELFNQLDVNGDGMIDQDEASALPALDDQFDDLDQDDSGDLDQQEFQEYQPEEGSNW